MKRIVFASLLAASSPALRAESVVLTPVKDTDIYSYQNRPTGSIYDLGVNNTPASVAPGLHSQKSLIQFDLAGVEIPAGEIGSAKLRLYTLAPDSEEGGGLRPGNLVVFRQGEPWGAVTGAYPNWNTVQPAGEPVAVFFVDTPDLWIEIDVTPLVAAWMAGTHPNHGFVLQCENEHVTATTNLLFGSMEYGKLAADFGLPEESQPFPKLVITRAEATPEPPVLAISKGEAGIALEWPVAGSGGWTLEATENPAGGWTAVEENPVQEGAVWRIVQAPNVSGRGFFRLAKP